MSVAPLHGRKWRSWCAAALRILGLAAAYYLAAKVGLLLGLVRGQVTPLWPPTGVALVGLLLLGLKSWPGITLGALLVNAPLGPSLPAATLIAVGNTLSPVCGYALLRRVGFHARLDRLRDVLALVFAGGLGSTLVSATCGTAVLAAAAAIPSDRVRYTWSVWWTGDAMGVLVVAPLLLITHARLWPYPMRPHRWVESAALLLGTAAVTVVVAESSVQLLFLVFPLLIWGSVRFREPGAAVCVLIVSVVTTRAAVVGEGTFAHRDPAETMFILQALNGTAALTALLLAALIHERDEAHAEVAHACRQLAAVIVQLDRDSGLGSQVLGAQRLRGAQEPGRKPPGPSTPP